MHRLVVEQLVKKYSTPNEDLIVLNGVQLTLDAGQNLAIVGPSGTGKSTLLQILGTLDRPYSGSVTLEGTEPFALNDNDLAKFRNEKIGFVFQDQYLLPHLSLLENMLVPILATRKVESASVERAEYLLDRVGLSQRKTHLPSELSGGERGRAAVARSLIMRPMLLLADEPTGNLDSENAERIASLLLELQKEENATMIVVTHSETVAKKMDQQMQMSGGRLHPIPH